MAALALAIFVGHLAAEECVVVVAESASPLEKLAASEIARMLGETTGEAPKVVGEAPANEATAIVVGELKEGSPAAGWLGAAPPKLEEEAIFLRSERRDGRDALIVAGGSGRAVLWAAYELGERLGYTYLLTGDIAPQKSADLKLPKLDVLLEPRIGRRAWVVMDASPSGMWGWSRQERRRLLGQLAKLKVNQAVIEVEPWQPLVRFDYGGVAKAPRKWWAIDPLPVDGDTAGRAVFKGAKEFINPDLEGASGEDLTEAAIGMLRGAIDDAHELGMTATIEIEVEPSHPNKGKFPAEFASLLPNAKFLDAHTIGVSVQRREPKDEQFETAAAIAGAQREAFVAAYPQADAYINYFSPPFAGDGKTSTARSPRAVGLTSNVGILPQELAFEAPGLASSAGELPAIRVWPRCLADFDVLAWRLSRSAWAAGGEEKSSPEALLRSIAGEGADARAALGLSFMQKAASALTTKEAAASGDDLNDVGPEMVWRHYQSTSPAPKAWQEATDHYVAAMNEMYRAHDRAQLRGRPWLRYFTKRLEFAVEYLTCLTALRAAGVAREKGDADEQLAQLEAAVESLYNGLQAYSEVARDPCDKGAIAVLNTYGYRRLKEEVDRLSGL